MINDPIVEIFPTEMSVSSSSLDFKDTFLDGEERDIKSTTTKIKDQDVLLSITARLRVKTIGNGCCSGLVMMRMTFKPAMTPASFVA